MDHQLFFFSFFLCLSQFFQQTRKCLTSSLIRSVGRDKYCISADYYRKYIRAITKWQTCGKCALPYYALPFILIFLQAIKKSLLRGIHRITVIICLHIKYILFFSSMHAFVHHRAKGQRNFEYLPNWGIIQFIFLLHHPRRGGLSFFWGQEATCCTDASDPKLRHSTSQRVAHCLASCGWNIVLASKYVNHKPNSDNEHIYLQSGKYSLASQPSPFHLLFVFPSRNQLSTVFQPSPSLDLPVNRL